MLPLRIILDRNRGGSYLAFFLATLGMFGVLPVPHLLLPGCARLQCTQGRRRVPAVPARRHHIVDDRVPGASTVRSAGARDRWLLARGARHAVADAAPAESAYAVHVVPAMLLISLGMGHVFVPLSSTALLGVPDHDAGAAALSSTRCSRSAARSVSRSSTRSRPVRRRRTSPAMAMCRRRQRSSTASPRRSPCRIGIMTTALIVVLTLIRPARPSQPTETGRRSTTSRCRTPGAPQSRSPRRDRQQTQRRRGSGRGRLAG